MSEVVADAGTSVTEPAAVVLTPEEMAVLELIGREVGGASSICEQLGVEPLTNAEAPAFRVGVSSLLARRLVALDADGAFDLSPIAARCADVLAGASSVDTVAIEGTDTLEMYRVAANDEVRMLLRPEFPELVEFSAMTVQVPLPSMVAGLLTLPFEDPSVRSVTYGREVPATGWAVLVVRDGADLSCTVDEGGTRSQVASGDVTAVSTRLEERLVELLGE